MVTACNNQRGFTFVEVVLVIIIIGILAGVATVNFDSAVDYSRHAEAQAELNNISDAIVGDASLVSGGVRTDYGYVGDVGALPANLDNLVTNPGGYATWNGPYLRDNFIENSGDFKTDPWNAGYGYSGTVTIQSTGSGSTITKQIANNNAELLSNTVQGVILDRDGAPPGPDAANIAITLIYPNGAGALTSTTVAPNSSGSFTLIGIPMGNQTISAVYSTANDTASTFVSVAPRVGGYVSNLRFGSGYWTGGGGGGGGGGGAGILYIPGTATISGAGINNVWFNITNSSDTALTLSWLSFTHAAAGIYAQVVKIDGQQKFNNNSDKLAPDDTAFFSSSYILAAKDTIRVQLNDFRSKETSGGFITPIPDNTDFSVTFSDGSTINFTAIL